jgi:hypothetical protein
MKYILTFLVLVYSTITNSQPRHIYISEDKKGYTDSEFHKLWYTSGELVVLDIVNRKPDSVFFLLRHYDNTGYLKDILKGSNSCGKRESKSIEQIKKELLAGQLAAIKLVSFKFPDTVFTLSIPKKNDKVDLEAMFEVKTLDRDIENVLLDILVNYKNISKTGQVIMCYEPRNAILFMDKADNILGYIEICFGCQKYIASEKSLQDLNFCDDKFEALRQIFMAAGIKYGMNYLEY